MITPEGALAPGRAVVPPATGLARAASGIHLSKPFAGRAGLEAGFSAEIRLHRQSIMLDLD